MFIKRNFRKKVPFIWCFAQNPHRKDITSTYGKETSWPCIRHLSCTFAIDLSTCKYRVNLHLKWFIPHHTLLSIVWQYGIWFVVVVGGLHHAVNGQPVSDKCFLVFLLIWFDLLFVLFCFQLFNMLYSYCICWVYRKCGQKLQHWLRVWISTNPQALIQTAPAQLPPLPPLRPRLMIAQTPSQTPNLRAAAKGRSARRDSKCNWSQCGCTCSCWSRPVSEIHFVVWDTLFSFWYTLCWLWDTLFCLRDTLCSHWDTFCCLRYFVLFEIHFVVWDTLCSLWDTFCCLRYTLFSLRYTLLSEIHLVLLEIHCCLRYNLFSLRYTLLSEIHFVLFEIHFVFWDTLCSLWDTLCGLWDTLCCLRDTLCSLRDTFCCLRYTALFEIHFVGWDTPCSLQDTLFCQGYTWFSLRYTWFSLRYTWFSLRYTLLSLRYFLLYLRYMLFSLR